MSEHEKQQHYPVDTTDGDEVEILEVVGLDEDEASPPDADEADRPDSVDADEIVLAIDEDDENPLAETAAAVGVAEVSEPAPRVDHATQAQFLRLQADYDNLRKRIARERQDYELLANSSLVGRLLPVLDNFERALSAAGNGSELAFTQGVSMIHKQLYDELRREGLRSIDSVGEKFDPNLHDAVATDPDSDEPANTVVEELQRGYLFQDRVLRPAMVKVSTRGGDRSCTTHVDDEGES